MGVYILQIYIHIFKIHIYKHKNEGIPCFIDCWDLWETESEKELRLQKYQWEKYHL